MFLSQGWFEKQHFFAILEKPFDFDGSLADYVMANLEGLS